MRLHRYKDAIVVETQGGVFGTLVDAAIANRMAKMYARDARAYFEKHHAEPSYLFHMAVTWQEFAEQLFVRWLTFGTGGVDRLVFKMKGEKR